MIYLDNAATTNPKPDTVYDAVDMALRSYSVNAGRGSYSIAREASQAIDNCKHSILRMAQITDGYRIFFTPSATHAMNQLIFGLKCDEYTNIYVTPFEHNAVMRPVHHLCQKTGCTYLQLPFDRVTWQFSVEEAQSLFARKKPDYIFVSMVSNTTGYRAPVEEITRLAHSYGAKVIVDCAQALGAIDVNLALVDADAYVFAGHKTLYGPFGIAGCIVKTGLQIEPYFFGGTGTDSLSLDMPAIDAGRYEPSSPNITAIMGLNASLAWLNSIGVSAIERREQSLALKLISSLTACPKVNLFVPPVAYCTGIVAFSVDGYQAHEVGEIFEEEFAILVRTGYQCAPLVHDWLGSKDNGGVVRASIGYFNSDEDIERLIEAVETL